MKKLFLLLCLVATTSFAGQSAKEYLRSRTVKFGPSDYYIDIWKESDAILWSLKKLGFTNLHAIYVDSHGGDINGIYAISPHESRCKKWNTPFYSVETLSKYMDEEIRTNVHNFYLGACNVNCKFRSAEVVKYFPNVTNVVYVMGGRCYSTTFLQSIITPLDKVEANLVFEGARSLPLMSEMFIKGQNKPYLTKIASREILYPNQKFMVHDISKIFEKK